MSLGLEILKSAYLIGEPILQNLNTSKIVPNMLLRRRLTRASKIAMELFWMLKVEQNYPLVCGSAYGELCASASILNALKDAKSPSPTDFQNSVYNTPASYITIANKNQNEAMTLSSGDNTSLKVLKVGAIKAMDNEHLVLLCFEALDIENIDEVNRCITSLECGVGLLVKKSTCSANIELLKSQISGVPSSISHMLHIAQEAQKFKHPIVRIEL